MCAFSLSKNYRFFMTWKKKRWTKALSPVYTVFLVIIFTIFVDVYCFLVSILGYGRLGEWHVWIFQDSDLTRISGIKKTHGQNHTNSRDYANRYMYFLEIDTRKSLETNNDPIIQFFVNRIIVIFLFNASYRTLFFALYPCNTCP